jgi:hypothetical protein
MWSMMRPAKSMTPPAKGSRRQLGVCGRGRGTAQVYVYPKARNGRLIADVVRLDKGHTEGLEPRITEELVKMIVAAPGGKAQRST